MKYVLDMKETKNAKIRLPQEIADKHIDIEDWAKF